MSSFTSDCTLVQYADDTQFLHQNYLSQVSDLVSRTESTLTMLKHYFQAIGLLINPTKTPELGKRSQNLDPLALLRSFRPDPSARALPLIFEGSPEHYPLTFALPFARSARALRSFLLLPLPFPQSALCSHREWNTREESRKRERRAESATTTGERKMQEESAAEEWTLNLGVPLSALFFFFFFFGTRALPLPIWSSAQSGGAELGTLLPTSAKHNVYLSVTYPCALKYGRILL